VIRVVASQADRANRFTQDQSKEERIDPLFNC